VQGKPKIVRRVEHIIPLLTVEITETETTRIVLPTPQPTEAHAKAADQEKMDAETEKVIAERNARKVKNVEEFIQILPTNYAQPLTWQERFIQEKYAYFRQS
jgi:hypothetical protein